MDNASCYGKLLQLKKDLEFYHKILSDEIKNHQESYEENMTFLEELIDDINERRIKDNIVEEVVQATIRKLNISALGIEVNEQSNREILRKEDATVCNDVPQRQELIPSYRQHKISEDENKNLVENQYLGIRKELNLKHKDNSEFSEEIEGYLNCYQKNNLPNEYLALAISQESAEAVKRMDFHEYMNSDLIKMGTLEIAKAQPRYKGYITKLNKHFVLFPEKSMYLNESIITREIFYTFFDFNLDERKFGKPIVIRPAIVFENNGLYSVKIKGKVEF